jgi:hypothetical protein
MEFTLYKEVQILKQKNKTKPIFLHKKEAVMFNKISQDINDAFIQDVNNLASPDPVHDVEIEEAEGNPEEDLSFISVDEPSDSDKDGDIIFVLDAIPGAPEAKDIEIAEEPEDVEIEEEKDGWKWNHSSFIPWMKGMIENIPKHSGYDSTGLEKAISYFEALDREITKAMRTDFKNEINSAHAEKARETIEKGLESLVERLDRVKTTKYKRHAKKSKGSDEQEGIVKEAATMFPSALVVTVPLLISRIARVCINGVVSGGHDMEDLFQKQAEEYKLDNREKAEVVQLLSDMGFPIQGDRGFQIGVQVDRTKSDNRDWAANYVG